MRLIEITVEGFRSFREPFTHRFSDGITAIVGDNGSGKSSLLDAAWYAVYGPDWMPGVKHEELVNDACSDMKVIVTLDISGQRLEIERSLHTTGSSATASLTATGSDGGTVPGSTIAEVQAEILKYVPPMDVLKTTVVQRQGELDALLSGTPAKQRDAIANLVAAPKEFDALHVDARNALKTLTTDAERAAESVKALEGVVERDRAKLIPSDEYAHIVDADQLAATEYDEAVAKYFFDNAEREREADKRIQDNMGLVAEHEENVRLHELHVAEQDAARAALEKERDAQVKWLTANYETAMAEWRRKVKSVRKINSDTLAAEKLKQRETDLVADLEAFDSVPPETCPTCKQNLTPEGFLSMVEVRSVKISTLEHHRANMALAPAIQPHQQDPDQPDRPELPDPAPAAQYDPPPTPPTLQPMPDPIEPVPPFERDPRIAVQESLQGRIAETLEQVKERAKQHADLNQRVIVQEAVTQCLSPQGARQLYIDANLRQAEGAANAYLEMFMPGHAVEFNTLTETGREMFDLVFATPAGVRSWGQFSGGEKAILSMAIQSGFADVAGRAHGFTPEMLILDEADGALRGPNQMKFLEAINRAAQAGKQVVIISHIADVLDVVGEENTVALVKGAEGTRRAA